MKKAGLNAKEVEGKLIELSGNMAAVARHFGVTRQAVWDFVHRRAELQQVAMDIREGMKDHAESALYNAALAGEAWAVCFFLKTQARDRGYTERPDEAEILHWMEKTKREIHDLRLALSLASRNGSCP
jgi:hypothetical protein